MTARPWQSWFGACPETATFTEPELRLTDRCPCGSRAWRAVASATLTLFAACGDGTGPSGGSAFYRIATVNARPLPYFCPPSATSGTCTISGGELLLRDDGAFALAIDRFGWLYEGTYVRGRDSLTFTTPNDGFFQPPITFSAAFAGDSVWFDISPPDATIVFRSSVLPKASITSATYTLTEGNGRVGQPVTLGDTVVNGTRSIYQVAFDSLWLSDGVFFRQHRKEVSFVYTPRGDTLRGENEGLSYGTFTSDGSWAVLHRYFLPMLSQTRTDSLAIDDGTLMRTTRLTNNRRQVERYSRIR